MQSISWCLPYVRVVCRGFQVPWIVQDRYFFVSRVNAREKRSRMWLYPDSLCRHKGWQGGKEIVALLIFEMAVAQICGCDPQAGIYSLSKCRCKQGGIRFFPNLLLKNLHKDLCCFSNGEHLPWHRQTEEGKCRPENPKSLWQWMECKTGGCPVLCRYHRVIV